MNFEDIFKRISTFKAEINKILSKHESSSSRVIDLYTSYKTLQGVSIQQEDLFKQALRCLENKLYRAAHVMAWAAFMDFLEEKIASDYLAKIHSLYPNWAKYKNIEILREYVSEYQLIEATKPLGLCTKTQVKALQGLLNKRNECAHPSNYYPNLNESLGYISELLQRIQHIKPIKL